MKTTQQTLCTLLLVCLSATGLASNAWLPNPGSETVGLSYAFETFDTFWRGDVQKPYPPGELDQYSAMLNVDYGVREGEAFDFSIGYTKAKARNGMSSSGRADSSIGYRWSLHEGLFQSWTPAMSVRLGAEVKGDYSTKQPWSAGDGVNAAATSFHMAFPRFETAGFTADFGYNFRDGVPDAYNVGFGFYKTMNKWVFSTQIVRNAATSGVDIGSPGFSWDLFPQLKEVSNQAVGSLSYRLGRGQTVSLLYANEFHGENVGNSDIFYLSFSQHFDQ